MEEEYLFQCRYENGYDLEHDKRYNKWVSLNDPNDLDDSNSVGEIALVSYLRPYDIYMLHTYIQMHRKLTQNSANLQSAK